MDMVVSMSNESPDDRLLARRYRLHTQVGRGGMGTVWQAHDEVLGRDVAVKEVILPFGLSDEERELQHRRTFREARTAARLAHPGVVTVYDVVEEDDRPWIVMELIKTQSLDQVIKKEGPLPYLRAAGIARQMLSALHAAHEAGVLHRDVKPSNVLLAPGDRAVLTDFGIATAAGDATLTATGLVMGSPAYIAPERARGRATGSASDLWSLGVTLYAMVDGRSPYERSEPMASLLAIITEEPPPAPNAGPLQPVIDGLLNKDPDLRLTAHEAGLMLDDIVRSSTTATPTIAEPVAVETAVDLPETGQVLHHSGRPPAKPAPPEPARNLDLGPRTVASKSASAVRSRTTVVVGAIVLITALVVGGLMYARSKDDAKNTSSSTQVTGNPTKKATTTPKASSSSKPSTSSPSSSPSSSATSSASSGLEFRTHTDSTGYSVKIPKNYSDPERKSEGDFFYSPDRRSYIQIAQTDDPGPSAIQDWRNLAKTKGGDYDEIAIRPTGDNPPVFDSTGEKSADWEFKQGSTHILDRGFVLNGKGYAILLSAPDSGWSKFLESMQPVFDSFTSK
jgi:serine/threonine protein kinase